MSRNEARDLDIFRRVLEGDTYEKAGSTVGISRVRVHQIVARIKRRIQRRYQIADCHTMNDMRRDKDTVKRLVDRLRAEASEINSSRRF